MNRVRSERRPSRARRLVRSAAIFLALGLALSALVACVGAYFGQYPGARERHGERVIDASGRTIPHPPSGRAPEGSRVVEIGLYDLPAVTFGISSVAPFQNYTPSVPPPVEPTPESIAARWERAELLPWSIGRKPWPVVPSRESIWAKAAGWPFRCFVCNTRTQNAPDFRSHTWSARGGIILGSPTRPGWADWPPQFPIIIPLRPMWPELLANTLMYAAAFALGAISIRTLATVRGRRRRERGLCPRCGYDLRGTAAERCPECGN